MCFSSGSFICRPLPLLHLFRHSPLSPPPPPPPPPPLPLCLPLPSSISFYVPHSPSLPLSLSPPYLPPFLFPTVAKIPTAKELNPCSTRGNRLGDSTVNRSRRQSSSSFRCCCCRFLFIVKMYSWLFQGCFGCLRCCCCYFCRFSCCCCSY